MKVHERSVCVGWLGVCLAAPAPAFSSNVDALYFGGPIVTVDDKNPGAGAVAVKAGKIIAVGSRTAVETAQKGPKTRMVDLGGKTMIPGFIDAHGHMMEGTVLIREFLRIMPRLNQKQQMALLEAGQDLYAKYGHTTAQEGRALPANVDLYIAAAKAGRLKLDAVLYPEVLLLGKSGFMKSRYAGRQYRDGLRIGGVKLTLDASPQGRTAWLSQPYLKPPPGQPASFAGYPALSDDQAITAVGLAYRNNWQIITHTNGDAAIDQLIKAVEIASARYPGKDRRPVMIHGQTLREDQVPKIKALGIFPALFPMHTFYWGDWYLDTVLGPERAASISPTGWMLKNDMIFSSQHDAPVAFPDTMRVLSATVNRTTRSNQVLGPEHRVEPIVGLKAMTLWAAYQHFEEKAKGSIEVGRLADFAILSDNPLTVERMKIVDIKVVETIKKGKSIYQADQTKVSGDSAVCVESSRCSEGFVAYTAHSPLATVFGIPPHMH